MAYSITERSKNCYSDGLQYQLYIGVFTNYYIGRCRERSSTLDN